MRGFSPLRLLLVWLFPLGIMAMDLDLDLERPSEPTCGRPPWRVPFKAGVVEFLDHLKPPDQSIHDHLLETVEKFDDIMEDCSRQGCDIIIFPEYGLTGIQAFSFKNILEYAQRLPTDPVTEEDCQEASKTAQSVITALSCSVRKHGLYAVVDLLTTPDGSKVYNTAVAFDRSGQIVATYRKYHKFGEPLIDAPEEVDISYFHTDFGATIGLFICFDINFRLPANILIEEVGVDFMAFPIAWVDEPPFLTAPQFHSGWATAFDTTVLGAGLLSPEHGRAGSAIYLKNHGLLNGTYDDSSGTRLVTGVISPGASNSREANFGSPKSQDHLYFFEDFSKYSLMTLPTGKHRLSLTHDDLSNNQSLTCLIDYELDVQEDNRWSNVTYQLVAYSGRRLFTFTTLGVQVCGVSLVADENDFRDYESCGTPDDETNSPPPVFQSLQIEAKFTSDVKPMPTHLGMDLNPLDYDNIDYHHWDSGYALSRVSSPVNCLFSMGLYGRDYANDQ